MVVRCGFDLRRSIRNLVRDRHLSRHRWLLNGLILQFPRPAVLQCAAKRQGCRLRRFDPPPRPLL